MKVVDGHNVSVHYKGTLTDGTEFDNSRTRGQTIAFQVGSGQMIPGFNDAVVGMATGETKSVTLAPTEAYGPRNEEALNTVPREAFGENFEFEVGATIQGNGPRGVFLAKIHDLQEENVILDMNHPLAGQSLKPRSGEVFFCLTGAFRCVILLMRVNEQERSKEDST